MNINFVLGHELPFPPEKGGGVNSLLDGLTVALVKAGHDVRAYSPTVPGRPDQETINGVHHIRVKGAGRNKSNPMNFLTGIPYALRVGLKMEPCDIMSCHLLHGFLLPYIFKAKVVTHTIHRDPKPFLKLFRGVKRIYTATDSVTEEAAKVVMKRPGLVKTVYNCVDFADYQKSSPLPSSDCTNFLFVGRFSRDKGLATLVEGFCKAAKENSRIRLKTLGPMTAQGGADEELIAEMNALVKSESLEDRVDFAQPVYTRAELDENLRACDVICLPSIEGETLNMSIIESMRIGRAILISDLPANAPLCVNGVTGFFSKCGDTNDWCAKIQDLASDRDRLELMAKEAYQLGRDRFSSEKIALEYISDFEQLLTPARF